MRQHPVLFFFLLTYFFSWAIEIPIALSVRSVIAAQIPLPVHYLASFGAGVAALIVVRVAPASLLLPRHLHRDGTPGRIPHAADLDLGGLGHPHVALQRHWWKPADGGAVPRSGRFLLRFVSPEAAPLQSS
jgi:hypothetical protein